MSGFKLVTIEGERAGLPIVESAPRGAVQTAARGVARLIARVGGNRQIRVQESRLPRPPVSGRSRSNGPADDEIDGRVSHPTPPVSDTIRFRRTVA
jgi:hypothetical protein